MQLRQITIGPRQQADNYELSDKGEDSDQDHDQQDRSHKHVPRWCDDYLKTLKDQSNIDPDTIFGSQVPKCDLEAIFTDDDYKKRGKERPKRRRGSSGEWKRDQLTNTEIAQYKAKCGQTRMWRTNIENIAPQV